MKTCVFMFLLLLVFVALGVQSAVAMCGASQGYGANSQCYTAGTCYSHFVWCEVQRCSSTWRCPSIQGGVSKQCAVLSCLNPFNNNCECV